MNLTDTPGDVRNVLREWSLAPTTHPRLGDWRRVGYRRGIWPPNYPGIVVAAQDRGVRPGDDNVAGLLQRAVDELGEAGGGVLELPPGRYVLDTALLIQHSNVVLRGSGSGSTTLHFTRPLVDTFGPARLGESTGWSWTGGNVFFIAPQRRRRSQHANWSSARPHDEGWIPGPIVAVAELAERGSYRLTVDDASGIDAGGLVLLETDIDEVFLRAAAGDIPGAATYDWAVQAATIAGPQRYSDFDVWRWPVKVASVNGDRVTLEQPLKLTLPAGARLRRLGPTIHDSGVEHLTIENALLPQTIHNINPGSNGVSFTAVHDCWAIDVRVLNADVAFGMTAAKSCQLHDISAGGRSLHHFVACRLQSHDNLIEKFTLDDFTVPGVPGSYLHGLNVEGLSSGNVYRDGVLHTGTFDSHRQLPFENLRTAIQLVNKDAVPGGAPNAGPYFGARSVNWGVNVESGSRLCMDIADVAPMSLTAGITGLDSMGSMLTWAGGDFAGPLHSQTLAFGIDLAGARDLLEVQRALAPRD